MRVPSLARLAIVAAATLVLGACGDAPTAPKRLDPAAVARVLPAVTDARLRLVHGITTSAVRSRAEDDLGQIEMALVRGDARSATFRTRLLIRLLSDYASQSEAAGRPDAADVVAIGLALVEAADVLNLAVDLSEFQ